MAMTGPTDLRICSRSKRSRFLAIASRARRCASSVSNRKGTRIFGAPVLSGATKIKKALLTCRTSPPIE